MTHLALVGYRGVGKSTIAREVAERRGCDWVDADDYLEQRAGQTIRQIFEQSGEATFRDLETECLTTLLALSRPHVLSLGGGVVLRPQNRSLLAATPTVWLRADAETIFRRLERDPSSHARRPALTARSGYDEIVELLAAREPLYGEVADEIVETADRSPAEIAEEIVCLMRGG